MTSMTKKFLKKTLITGEVKIDLVFPTRLAGYSSSWRYLILIQRNLICLYHVIKHEYSGTVGDWGQFSEVIEEASHDDEENLLWIVRAGRVEKYHLKSTGSVFASSDLHKNAVLKLHAWRGKLFVAHQHGIEIFPKISSKKSKKRLRDIKIKGELTLASMTENYFIGLVDDMYEIWNLETKELVSRVQIYSHRYIQCLGIENTGSIVFEVFEDEISTCMLKSRKKSLGQVPFEDGSKVQDVIPVNQRDPQIVLVQKTGTINFYSTSSLSLRSKFELPEAGDVSSIFFAKNHMRFFVHDTLNAKIYQQKLPSKRDGPFYVLKSVSGHIIGKLRPSLLRYMLQLL